MIEPGNHLIDEILPVAAQKGTGMWTSQTAMELQVPVPTIDIAVAMRDLSGFVDEREQASLTIDFPYPHLLQIPRLALRTTTTCTFCWNDSCVCARNGAFKSCF